MQGIIVFASVMATLGLQILFESIRAIITKVMVVIFFQLSLINNLTVTASIFVEHSYVFFTILWAQSRPDMDTQQEKWMIGIMVSVTLVKFLLMVYCRRFNNEIVRAYAQDHFFDVITNSVGLVTAVLAVRFYWWIDPTGAIIVSFSKFCRVWVDIN